MTQLQARFWFNLGDLSIFFIDHQFDAIRVLSGTRGVVSIVISISLLVAATLFGFERHQRPR